MAKDNLRSLPSVDQILNAGALAEEIRDLSQPLVAMLVREALASARKSVRKNGTTPTLDELVALVKIECRRLARRRITRVINGTGVLIHTNLGRSPLGKALLTRVVERVQGYSTLEFDLETGKRGRRGSFLAFLLAQLTGAKSALAVNNNAAALFLILNTFANKREVIVSRSELVQIGGGFRIPDIIRRAGAKLVEVGTTNQTSLRDYKDAITAKTALILKVHRSNFHLKGFVDEVTPEKLAELADKKGLISVYDLGSGAYHQTERFGMETEPNITAALRSQSSLVCFSGDKLFGSTQAGVVLGGEEQVEALHANPIYRVVRLDKISLAVLEESALGYLRKEDATLLPLWRQITTTQAELRSRAAAIVESLTAAGIRAQIQETVATPGGGSLPGGTLPSIGIVLSAQGKVAELSRRLLDSTPPLIGYVEKEMLYLDLRTIAPEEDAEVATILTHLAECIQ